MQNLFTIILADGLPTKIGNVEHRYFKVILRELTVMDEFKAASMAEKVVNIPGQGFSILTNNEVRDHALIMLSIDKFIGDADRTITNDLINLEMIGRLSPHDWDLISTQVLLIESSARLRYGEITETQYQDLLNSVNKEGAKPSHKPTGEVKDVAGADSDIKPTPERLA